MELTFPTLVSRPHLRPRRTQTRLMLHAQLSDDRHDGRGWAVGDGGDSVGSCLGGG